jgi:hypothetical protein
VQIIFFEIISFWTYFDLINYLLTLKHNQMENLFQFKWLSNDDYKIQFLNLYKKRLNQYPTLQNSITLRYALNDFKGIQWFRLVKVSILLLTPFILLCFKVNFGYVISSGIISFGLLLLIIQFAPHLLPRFQYSDELDYYIDLLIKSVSKNINLISYEMVEKSLRPESKKDIKIELIKQFHELVHDPLMKFDRNNKLNPTTILIVLYYISHRTFSISRNEEDKLYLLGSLFKLGIPSLCATHISITNRIDDLHSLSDKDEIIKSKFKDWDKFKFEEFESNLIEAKKVINRSSKELDLALSILPRFKNIFKK